MPSNYRHFFKVIYALFSVIDAEHENEIMESDNTTVDTMLYSLPSKRKKNSDNSEELSFGVQERLDNIESHLKLSGKTY